MSRPLRIEFPGATYHVMNRGLAVRPIFQTAADRATFLEGLGAVHARWGLQIFAYCLMRNHYHLCVQTPRVPLSRIMRHVDGVYTQHYNRRHRRAMGRCSAGGTAPSWLRRIGTSWRSSGTSIRTRWPRARSPARSGINGAVSAIT